MLVRPWFLVGFAALTASGGWLAARGIGGDGPEQRSERSRDELSRLERLVARLEAEDRARRHDDTAEGSGDASRDARSDAAADQDAAAAAPVGESAAELLARLERDYQAARAQDRMGADSTDPLLLATNSETSTLPATVPAPLPATAEPAQALPAADQAVPSQAVPSVPQPVAVPQPMAVARLDQTNIGTIHNETHVHETHVHETQLNQVSMVTQYQQLLLIGASTSGSRSTSSSSSTAAPRKPGPSPNDSNPWASTDYSSHYANPWGPIFGRRP
ncbi:MAG TPA: hypothetical protein VLC09_02445 [Polyangiaceae bacterium]|nr:hypothetical protein [Polyangiaceae bacterium]